MPTTVSVLPSKQALSDSYKMLSSVRNSMTMIVETDPNENNHKAKIQAPRKPTLVLTVVILIIILPSNFND